MNRWIRLGITFALALGALPAAAFAQAAGESVLLNSGSAAATAKAGKAFKAASDRVSKQLADRVHKQTSPAARKASPTGAQPASATAAQNTSDQGGTTSASGPMIVSIQGAKTPCALTDQAGPTPENKTAAGDAPKDCTGQTSPSKAEPEKHPSVITLSFSK